MADDDDDDDEEDGMIKLNAQGKEFKISVKNAQPLLTVMDAIDDAGTSNPIPLINMEASTLCKLLEYCEFLANNDDPRVINEGNSAFLDSLDETLLCKMILASNYIDFKELLKLTCGRIASMLEGKSTKEMREILNIKNDWEENEEEQIRIENSWCKIDTNY